MFTHFRRVGNPTPSNPSLSATSAGISSGNKALSADDADGSQDDAVSAAPSGSSLGTRRRSDEADDDSSPNDAREQKRFKMWCLDTAKAYSVSPEVLMPFTTVRAAFFSNSMHLLNQIAAVVQATDGGALR